MVNVSSNMRASLHELAYDGQVDELQLQLTVPTESLNSLLESCDANGRSVLSAAAGGGDMHIIKMLLSLGAVVNTVDNMQQSPFYWACANNHLAAALHLLENGSDVMSLVRLLHFHFVYIL